MKKYLENAYCTVFTTEILKTTTYTDGRPALILNETYFYPEGGGQPCDTGSIEDIVLVDVQIENDIIYHIFKPQDLEKIKVLPQTVKGSVNWSRRFSLMQQHTGQHILSAAAEKLFEANTIGFHIGEDYITIDLDQKRSESDVKTMEDLANHIVFQNRNVIAHYPNTDELLKMPLRKQPKVTEAIRVIEVEGFDFSPCGGIHVHLTGEIGLIKVKKIENYKQGIRIEFVCGHYALAVFEKQNEIINALSRLFSCRDHEIVGFAQSLIENAKQDKKTLQSQSLELLSLKVDQLLQDYDEIEGIKVIRLTEVDLSMNDLRNKVQMICKHPDYIVLAQSTEGEKCNIVLAKSKDDRKDLEVFSMNDFFRNFGHLINIKGGGNPHMAQGSTEITSDIEAFFNAIEQNIQEVV